MRKGFGKGIGSVFFLIELGLVFFDEVELVRIRGVRIFGFVFFKLELEGVGFFVV